MEYRRMGRTGLKVSEICLGTMTFGHGTGEAESRRIVDAAIGAGVNFFDTANSYGEGESEVLLGKALEGRRDDAVVATKFFNPMGSGPNDSGMSRLHIMQAVEASLRRLRMDHVDLYYIHHVDTQTPLEEMLRALDDLVHQGKVRYTACSNYQAWRLCEALWISDANGWARFECFQPQYSLVVRDIEQELIPLCLHKGLGVVVWSPLGGGFLSGSTARAIAPWGARGRRRAGPIRRISSPPTPTSRCSACSMSPPLSAGRPHRRRCAGSSSSRPSPPSLPGRAPSSSSPTTCRPPAGLSTPGRKPGSMRSPTCRTATRRRWRRTCTSAETPQ